MHTERERKRDFTHSQQRNGETLAEKVVFAGRHKLHVAERGLVSIKLHIQVKGSVNQSELEIKRKEEGGKKVLSNQR